MGFNELVNDCENFTIVDLGAPDEGPDNQFLVGRKNDRYLRRYRMYELLIVSAVTDLWEYSRVQNISAPEKCGLRRRQKLKRGVVRLWAHLMTLILHLQPQVPDASSNDTHLHHWLMLVAGGDQWNVVGAICVLSRHRRTRKFCKLIFGCWARICICFQWTLTLWSWHTRGARSLNGHLHLHRIPVGSYERLVTINIVCVVSRVKAISIELVWEVLEWFVVQLELAKVATIASISGCCGCLVPINCNSTLDSEYLN